MLVIGSGAIGVEFAYVYAAMGTKVTIVEFLPTMVPVEDEDVSKELTKQYKKMGVDVYVNSSVEKVDTSGKGCKVTVKTPDGEKTFEVDVVLSAAGVVVNIENIGLEEMRYQNRARKDCGERVVRNQRSWLLCHWRLYARPGSGARCYGRRNHLRGENCRTQNRSPRLQQHSRLYLLPARNCLRGYDREESARSRLRHQSG